MALGKRGGVQGEFWVSAENLQKSPGHPFYQKLNGLLAEVGFYDWVESGCSEYYADRRGRPGIPVLSKFSIGSQVPRTDRFAGVNIGCRRSFRYGFLDVDTPGSDYHRPA